MKRFYFGGEEDNDEDDPDSFEMPSASELISIAQADNPFKTLIDFSVRICESSWLWRFLSLEKKISMVLKVFIKLSNAKEEYEKNAEI